MHEHSPTDRIPPGLLAWGSSMTVLVTAFLLAG